MLGLKLIHVSKKGLWVVSESDKTSNRKISRSLVTLRFALSYPIVLNCDRCIRIYAKPWLVYSEAEWYFVAVLTHWDRVTHTYASRLTIIGSDNGLSPGRRQDIIWTNAGKLLIGPLGTSKFIHFHPGKCIWKCRLGNGGHFVLASMCQSFESHGAPMV